MTIEVPNNSQGFLENSFIGENLCKTTLKTKNTWFFATLYSKNGLQRKYLKVK